MRKKIQQKNLLQQQSKTKAKKIDNQIKSSHNKSVKNIEQRPLQLSQKRQPSLQKQLSQQQQYSIPSQSQTDSLQYTQQQVMYEAIQKANCLIELLTRENFQSKSLIDDLNQKIQQLEYGKLKLQRKQKQYLEKVYNYNQQKENLQKQNEELIFQVEKAKLTRQNEENLKQKLEESKKKNKLLYQKIAFVSKTSIDMAKELQTVKKQYKSLQNQNQYLLSQLSKSQEKQNIFSQNISFKESIMNKKMTDLEGTKQAFVRRTHELKQQNINLLMQISNLQAQKYDLQLINQQTFQKLDHATKKLESYRYFEEKIGKIYEKIILNPQKKYFKQHQLSIRDQLEEIQLVLSFRFQHIQSLLKQISQRLERQDWKYHLRELNETQIFASRLNNYLTQLVNGKGTEH